MRLFNRSRRSLPWMPVLVCGLLGACSSQRPAQVKPQGEVPPAATAVAPTPAAAPKPNPLGARRLGRIEAAYQNLGAAVAEWQLSSYGQDCVLVFNQTEEWLVGCPEMAAKSGFVATDERWRDQPVLWNPQSLMLSGQFMPYEQVKLGLVGTVGSYTGEVAGEQVERPLLLLQEWDALHQNHPGFQQSNLEEWLGVFVHEAFHARQLYHPRVRAQVQALNFGKGAVTPDELAGFYKQNAAFKEAVKKEYDLLRAASDDSALNAKKARRALSQWLKLYRARRAAFEPALEQAFPGKQAWAIDGFVTFLEGSARYVEARFLMAPSDGSLAQLGEEPTFKGFAVSRGKRPSELPGLGGLGGKYFYSLGMYLCFLLDVAEPSWKSTVFGSEGLLVGQVERSAGGKK